MLEQAFIGIGEEVVRMLNHRMAKNMTLLSLVLMENAKVKPFLP
jgi:hypothetical protein